MKAARRWLVGRAEGAAAVASAVMVVGGLAHLWLLAERPLLSQGFYVDENALNPTLAEGTLPPRMARRLLPDAPAPGLAAWAADEFERHGLEAYGDGNASWAVVRAPHGDGLMSLALLAGDAAAARVAVAVARHLASPAAAAWLDKDVVVAVVTGEAAVDAWLDDYYGVVRRRAFGRAGTLLAAVALEDGGCPAGAAAGGELSLLPAGRSGVLPNLDLLSALAWVAKPAGLRVTHSNALPRSSWLARLPRWAAHQETVARSWAHLMHPRGLHLPFLARGVDAVTARAMCVEPARVAAVVERALRSLNNLHERLHHSTFLYLPTASDSFVTMNRYFNAFVLLLLPLPLSAFAALLFGGGGGGGAREAAFLAALVACGAALPVALPVALAVPAAALDPARLRALAMLLFAAMLAPLGISNFCVAVPALLVVLAALLPRGRFARVLLLPVALPPAWLWAAAGVAGVSASEAARAFAAEHAAAGTVAGYVACTIAAPAALVSLLLLRASPAAASPAAAAAVKRKVE